MKTVGLVLIFEGSLRMSEKVNIGVLGCAKIAEKSILPAIKLLNEHYNLVGISSRSKEKAEQFSIAFKTKPYLHYEDLLSVRGLDAVYIPLPNSLHKHWIDKALNAGLHVLVEKPMACNFDEVIKLNQIAADKKLLLMESFQFRFHPQLEFIKKLIDNGEIGELRSVKSAFAFPPFSDPKNIRYNSQLGGGALLDAGAYPLKILQIFLGYDIDVIAAKSHFDAVKGVDLWGSAYLGARHNDIGAYIDFGFDNYYQCHIELVGSLGRIYTDRIFTAPSSYSPIINIHKTISGSSTVELSSANHFVNLLMYFKNQIIDQDNLSDEYQQNVNQSRLISEFQAKARSLQPV